MRCAAAISATSLTSPVASAPMIFVTSSIRPCIASDVLDGTSIGQPSMISLEPRDLALGLGEMLGERAGELRVGGSVHHLRQRLEELRLDASQIGELTSQGRPRSSSSFISMLLGSGVGA